MKKHVITCLILLVVAMGIVSLSSCTVGRALRYNFAGITDYKIFPSAPLKASTQPFQFYRAAKPNWIPDSIQYKHRAKVSIDRFMQKSNTVAFLVMRNDTIYFERYYNHYDTVSIGTSFSMAKSFLSTLIGIAIDEGYIKSVNEPVSKYIPELKKNGFDKMTIEHLLTMSSGLKYKESYVNPFGKATFLYYGDNLRQQMVRYKISRTPGTHFEYLSSASQLLGLVLERALKGKHVTQYLQEKMWAPMGMEFDGSWSTDRTDSLAMEKTFCCVNARARDFLKYGRLYLHNGNWNGKQIVSSNWVKASTTPVKGIGRVPFYGYQWWLGKNNDYSAQGILGQFVYVNPKENLVIVRLGKNMGRVNWEALLPQILTPKK